MLTGRRILVVIDEPQMAQSVCGAVVSRGGQPFGPVSDIWEALEWLARERIDGAIVNFDLSAGDAAALAHALSEGGKGVLMFSEGDLADRLFEHFPGVAVCRAPVTANALADAMATLVGPRDPPRRGRR